MANKREVLGARVHPDTIQICKKLAKKKYGKESKIGYVVDDAVKACFTNESRPAEASAILSTAEEVLIDRLDRRVNSIFDNVINRMGDLYARTSHDSAVTFVMMEDLFLKTGGTKDEVGKLRGDAQRIMQKRAESAGALDSAKENFNNTFSSEGSENNPNPLQEENQQLKEKIEQMKNKYNRSYQGLQDNYKNLDQEKQRIEKEKDNITKWYEGLENHLRKNYSIMKKNNVLIEDYKKSNPFPVS